MVIPGQERRSGARLPRTLNVDIGEILRFVGVRFVSPDRLTVRFRRLLLPLLTNTMDLAGILGRGLDMLSGRVLPLAGVGEYIPCYTLHVPGLPSDRNI